MSIQKQKLKKLGLNKYKLKKLPQTPGVYLFWNKENLPLYVGKANNLKRRVSSYFSANLSSKTAKMIQETENYSYIRVNSEIEALLLEARLIKKNQPKYNASLRDDKHPLYIRITKEKYPRVLTARKIEETPPAGKKNLSFYGPFPSAGNVKNVLILLRKIFPYSDHKLGKRECLYSQIGQCNPCPNKIENIKNKTVQTQLRKCYRDNIKLLESVLSGRIKRVTRNLEKKMDSLAKNEKFEEAIKVRQQIEKLNYLTQPVTPISNFLKNPNLIEDIRAEELRKLREILSENVEVPRNLKRIECYDVAHLSGTKPVASMVTFIRGEPDKSLYRHFRIRQGKGQDDTASLKEVVKRRIGHLSSWGIPDLIIVDGGKAQVMAFLEVLNHYEIPVVGLVKKRETLVIPIKVGGVNLHHPTGSFIFTPLTSGPARNLVQRIRDEAHRFARRYHHKLLQKDFIPN